MGDEIVAVENPRHVIGEGSYLLKLQLLKFLLMGLFSIGEIGYILHLCIMENCIL